MFFFRGTADLVTPICGFTLPEIGKALKPLMPELFSDWHVKDDISPYLATPARSAARTGARHRRPSLGTNG